MICKFRNRCQREATHICKLCSDPVCLEHSAPKFHFYAVKLEEV